MALDLNDPSQLAALVGAANSGQQLAAPDYAALLGYAQPTPQAQPQEFSTPVLPDPNSQGSAVASPVTLPSQAPAGPANEPATTDLPAPSVAPQAPDPNLSAPAPGLSPGQAVGGGYSVSGFNPNAFNAIQAGPAKGVRGQIAGEKAQANAEFAPILADSHAATQAAIDATTKQGEIEAQRIAALGEGKAQIAQAQQGFIDKESAAIAESQAAAKGAQADYRAALADWAGSKVNPAQLWDAGGKVGQFAMVATAFGHDFLGARGIKTSGMDSINKAIQNNINAQLANIEKKGQVAAGFKNLWDMQRQQSASDSEARERMRGFYLEGIKNQIDANLSGYDSELARAKAQAAKAELVKEQVKNDLLVKQHIDKAFNDRAQQRIELYKADLSASSARYSADAHLKAAQIAAGAKDKSHPLDGVIFDTSTSGKNLADRRFLPGTPPATQATLREQNAKVLNTSEKIQELIQLQEAAGRVPPTDFGPAKKLQGEAKRAAEQVRTLVRTSLLYDSTGKAINEKEMEIFDEIVGKKDWWLNGDNTRALSILAKSNLDKQKAIMSGVSTKIGPGDPVFGYSSGPNTTAPGESTLFDIQSQPGSGKPGESEVDKYQKWAASPNALEAYDIKKVPKEGPGNQATVSRDWSTFLEENPNFNLKDTKIQAKRTGDTSILGGFDSAHETARSEKNPDRAFIQLERLADLALSGDKSAENVIHALADGELLRPEGEGDQKKVKFKKSGSESQSDQDAILSMYAKWEEARLAGKKVPGQENATEE